MKPRYLFIGGLVVMAVVATLGSWYQQEAQTSEHATSTPAALNQKSDQKSVSTSSATKTTAPKATAVIKPSLGERVVSKPQTTPVTTPSPTGHTVVYTDTGFAPVVLEIKAGTPVTFINSSHRALYVKTNSQNPDNYTNIDEGKSMPAGQSFTYNFNYPGAFGYINLNNPKDLGTIVVTR